MAAEKFRKPENWDKVAEGPGWAFYIGGNDWEVCVTFAWVVFGSDDANRRLWMDIKFPDEVQTQSVSSAGEKAKPAKTFAEKAWRAWLRLAKAAHRNKNHGSRSWLNAFKSALEDKSMKTFIKRSGEETTSWAALAEKKARQVVHQLLSEEGPDDEFGIDDYLGGDDADHFHCWRSKTTKGDGFNAPMRIVLHHSINSRPGRDRWVVHYENMQVGGYSNGYYAEEDRAAAEAEFKRRCQRYGLNPNSYETFTE